MKSVKEEIIEILAVRDTGIPHASELEETAEEILKLIRKKIFSLLVNTADKHNKSLKG